MATGLNTAALQVAATAVVGIVKYLQLHTAAPDATGNTNLTTAARQPVTLTATAGNLAIAAQVAFTGGAANGPVTAVSFWDSLTGGVNYGYETLTGDASFNSAGQYTVTAVNFADSSS